jgi:hypothetical protein
MHTYQSALLEEDTCLYIFDTEIYTCISSQSHFYTHQSTSQEKSEAWSYIIHTKTYVHIFTMTHAYILIRFIREGHLFIHLQHKDVRTYLHNDTCIHINPLRKRRSYIIHTKTYVHIFTMTHAYISTRFTRGEPHSFTHHSYKHIRVHLHHHSCVHPKPLHWWRRTAL